MKRSSGQVSGVVVLFTTTILLAGCGSNADEGGASEDRGATHQPATTAPSNEVDESFRPQLDEKLGRVILPYTGAVPSKVDQAILMQAVSMKIAVCAREQGIDMVAAPLYDDLDVYYQEQFFGPWTIEQAEKFGFTPPMRDADLVANGVVPKDFVGHTQPALRAAGAHNASLEEKYSAQLDKCQEKAVDTYQAMRAIRGTPWNDQLGVLRESIVKEPKFVKALDDLGECLHEHGLKPAEKLPGFVEGFDEKHITEEQVTMAVQVVQCKNSVDFTQRVADLWAGLQAPILKKYDKEIAAQRKENAAAVSAARAFVASHPEVLVP